MTFHGPLTPTVADLKSGNIIDWMHKTRVLYNPLEQARWNQSNIDTLFVAGEQRFINNYFQFYPSNNFQNFHFNLIQQPINMVTGYQRQHRKSITFLPIEGSSQDLSDELNACETYANNYRRRLEKFSQGCELSCVSGMCLAQPFLDFRTDDPVNGILDLKIWPYNSFFIDPFFRDFYEMSDCNFIWTQQYITKNLALSYFEDRVNDIEKMSGMQNTNFTFYFLPENYNAVRSNFLVLSHIWYQTTRKKKVLYNKMDGLTYDFYDDEKFIQEAVNTVGFFEILEIEVPTWNVAVVLNDKVMYHGHNPLKFDRCPFVPIVWNYDPHVAQPDLRVRSLTRAMRDTQFLMNRRIIINHDISESSINSGWLRKENSIVNEDDLKYSGQGKDVIVKTGYELTDIQKIVPNAVPPSDMELANQLADFIFRTSGINQELLGMATDSDTGIEAMLRQGAGLITLQKYFDQWDVALKQIGSIDKEIMQRFWSAAKVSRITGKPPSNEFKTKIFSRHNVQVAEGLNTTVQEQNEFFQILKLNEALGGIIPARFILQKATIQGKNEIIEAVDAAQQQAAELQKQEALINQALLEAQMQALQAKSANDIASAKERHGRTDSNLGLWSERLSEISQNRAAALKAKAEAIKTLLEAESLYGQKEVEQQENQIEDYEKEQVVREDREKLDTKRIFNADIANNKLEQNLL